MNMERVSAVIVKINYYGAAFFTIPTKLIFTKNST